MAPSEVARGEDEAEAEVVERHGHFLPRPLRAAFQLCLPRALAADPPMSQSRSVVGRSRASSSVTARPEPPCCCQQSWKRPPRHVPMFTSGKKLPGLPPARSCPCPAGRTPCRKGAPPPASGSTGALIRWWCRRRSRPGRTVDEEVRIAHRQVLEELALRLRVHAPSIRARGTQAPQRAACRARSAGARASFRSSSPVSSLNATFARVGQRGLEAVPADERDAVSPGEFAHRELRQVDLPVDARAAVVVPARDPKAYSAGRSARAIHEQREEAIALATPCRGRAAPRRAQARVDGLPAGREQLVDLAAALASLRSARTRSSRTFMPRERGPGAPKGT